MHRVAILLLWGPDLPFGSSWLPSWFPLGPSVVPAGPLLFPCWALVVLWPPAGPLCGLSGSPAAPSWVLFGLSGPPLGVPSGAKLRQKPLQCKTETRSAWGWSFCFILLLFCFIFATVLVPFWVLVGPLGPPSGPIMHLT